MKLLFNRSISEFHLKVSEFCWKVRSMEHALLRHSVTEFQYVNRSELNGNSVLLQYYSAILRSLILRLQFHSPKDLTTSGHCDYLTFAL